VSLKGDLGNYRNTGNLWPRLLRFAEYNYGTVSVCWLPADHSGLRSAVHHAGPVPGRMLQMIHFLRTLRPLLKQGRGPVR
jgi:hypothetical protein